MTLIKIRKVIASVIFILFVLLFLGAEKLSVPLSQVLLPFQFVPALIRTIIQPVTLSIVGLIFIVLITLIFGRVYCSFLCPLGSLQDIFIALSCRIGWQPKHSFSNPYSLLRHTILALTVVATSLGLLWLLNLLDPYSLTGKILTHFFQSLLVWIYNAAISILKIFDIYLYPKQTAFIPASVVTVTAGFLLLVIYLSLRHGRLYCNAICPVGTLLGLISRVSFFKYVLDQKDCSECRLCEKVCKASCIDSQNAAIDMSRCVGCFNCLDACSKATISYQRRRSQTNAGTWSPARRGFVIGSVAAAGSLFLACNTNIRRIIGINNVRAHPPVTPPGSLSTAHFTQACIACSLCVNACPTQVLTPTFIDYGMAGLLQPKMNYEKSFCEYECNVCGEVCPTGAILPMPLTEKKLIQIGEARLLEDVCVVYVNKKNCGACGEVCPTHAINFVNKENILYPKVDTKYCIGCGACQIACPTTPKSIVVQPNPVHKKAQKNMIKSTPIEQEKTPNKDFPF